MIRRWLLRLLALAALAGVGYGVYTIVREGTEEPAAGRGPVQERLRDLAASQARLGRRLDALRPGASPGQVRSALRDTQRDYDAAVRALRTAPSPVADEARVDDALGAHFDYLDALRSVLGDPRSPLRADVADRAQAAKDAFTALPGSEGVEDGIRGTHAFLAWARAR